ncbi:MAG: hypothetical protein VX899_20190 [Myxococcota bacterium]|nr:hypothetical protein [Myxococcota bacterium]
MWQQTQSWIAAQANPDGGWGYLPGQPSSAEPTLLALACSDAGDPAWLDRAELGWAALMGPSLLRRRDPGRARALVDAVLALQGDPGGISAGTYDASIPGWAWVDGTFSWVEPTAWGVLGLRAQDQAEHPRCVQGTALLVDRQCSDGGWNSGNPDVLGADLPGYLYAAGLCALALPPGDAVERALEFAEGVREAPSTLNLSYAILARLRHGRDPSVELELLRKRQVEGAFSGRVDRNALAVLALQAAEIGRSPLLLEA